MSGGGGPLVVALDAGTSLVKAVAFTAGGESVGAASRPNRVELGPGGAAEQDMGRVWDDAAAVLAELAARLGSGAEIAALAAGAHVGAAEAVGTATANVARAAAQAAPTRCRGSRMNATVPPTGGSQPRRGAQETRFAQVGATTRNRRCARRAQRGVG